MAVSEQTLEQTTSPVASGPAGPAVPRCSSLTVVLGAACRRRRPGRAPCEPSGGPDPARASPPPASTLGGHDGRRGPRGARRRARRSSAGVGLIVRSERRDRRRSRSPTSVASPTSTRWSPKQRAAAAAGPGSTRRSPAIRLQLEPRRPARASATTTTGPRRLIRSFAERMALQPDRRLGRSRRTTGFVVDRARVDGRQIDAAATIAARRRGDARSGDSRRRRRRRPPSCAVAPQLTTAEAPRPRGSPRSRWSRDLEDHRRQEDLEDQGVAGSGRGSASAGSTARTARSSTASKIPAALKPIGQGGRQAGPSTPRSCATSAAGSSARWPISAGPQARRARRRRPRSRRPSRRGSTARRAGADQARARRPSPEGDDGRTSRRPRR